MKVMKVDAVVAGAGIWGCTVARRLAEAGRHVLVLEKRPVVGGNVRCEVDAETGIEVHTYGSHIFHTHIPAVWDFVNRFVTFNGYQHKVLTNYKGRIYHLPLGLTLINKFFDVELKPGEVKGFLEVKGRSEKVFDAFFRGYTCKQWGKSPEEIDPSIIKRVPVRSNYDTNYFTDTNQGIPLSGYNSLFDRMLDHPNIVVRCSAALRFEDGALKCGGAELPSVPVYYSGPIDALFDYRFGHLPWRTLNFEMEKLNVCDYQGTSVVNYAEAEVPYTRIHEFKHYHPEDAAVMNAPHTVIMREYPAAWKPGDEPYYPIDTAESRSLLDRYREELAKVNKSMKSGNGVRIVCGGRLGGYRYNDMDKSVEAALKVEL